MELLTGDRPVPNSTDFPQQISPFPATGNLLISNPMANIHSSDIDRQNLPPQKLRPIRANGRSPSSSQINDLSLAAGLDGTLENLGLLADQVCGINREACEYFKPPAKAEASDVAVTGFGELRAPYLVEDSETIGSGAGAGNQNPNSEGGALVDEFSSSSDDDSSGAGMNESARRKRKRKTREKLENFLENMVRQILQKQDQMHKQLIETMERKELERIMREEAWKQQEKERRKRDEEVRAQENARSLALISFIQNVMGHKIEIPQSLTTEFPLAPQPLTTEFPLAASHGEKDGSSICIQSDLKSDPSNRRWPDTEVQALIMLRTALEQKFRAMGAKCSNIWDEVSAGMSNMGYNRTAKKCKEKWENINKYFRKSMESGGKKRHENSKTCPYFHELHILYKNGFVNPGNANIENEANSSKE
ncbi:hypothetical protein JCGZ_01336 [Jatropha curcas]|uniref:Myb-like domain-containing protein n=1 Tax=Jatropha curcas TaxID=180498 RepID=A0A067L8R1_JATCU|nr:trihelix transcription factor GTL1 [Jatropha curcas]KDP44836.1 hypothetical protein JCGZ_01336 [Jatropha curcas]